MQLGTVEGFSLAGKMTVVSFMYLAARASEAENQSFLSRDVLSLSRSLSLRLDNTTLTFSWSLWAKPCLSVKDSCSRLFLASTANSGVSLSILKAQDASSPHFSRPVKSALFCPSSSVARKTFVLGVFPFAGGSSTMGMLFSDAFPQPPSWRALTRNLRISLSPWLVRMMMLFLTMATSLFRALITVLFICFSRWLTLRSRSENQSEKKKVFFLSGKGGYPLPPLNGKSV